MYDCVHLNVVLVWRSLLKYQKFDFINEKVICQQIVGHSNIKF